jgi:hypothetical protein
MYEELGALEPYHFERTDLSFSADAAGDTAGDTLLRGLGGSTCGEHGKLGHTRHTQDYIKEQSSYIKGKHNVYG